MEKILVIVGLGAKLNLVAKRIQKLTRDSDDVKIISWDTELVSGLNDKGFCAATGDIYSSNYIDPYTPYDQSVEIFKRILSKIASSKEGKFKEVIDCALPYLVAFCGARMIVNLNIAKGIIEVESPGKVVLLNYKISDFLQNAFLCFREDLDIEIYDAGKRWGRKTKNYLKLVFRLFAFSTYYIICAIANKFKFKKHKKDILFVAPSAHQLLAFSPFIDNKPGVSTMFLCTSGKKHAKSKKDEHKGINSFSQYSSFGDILKVPYETLKFIFNWNKLKKKNSGDRIFLYNGVSLENFFYDIVEQEIPFRSDIYIDSLLKAERMLDFEKPKILVVTEDPAPKIRTILTYAKIKGIKTTTISFGFVRPHSAVEMFPITDFYIVNGNHAKKYLIQNGLPEDKIFITSTTRLTMQKEDDVSNKEDICNRYGLDSSKPIILVTSNGFGYEEPGMESPHTIKEYSDWLSSIYKLSRAIPEYQIVVKPHLSSRDPLFMHERIKGKVASSAFILKTQGCLYEFIDICDVMITWLSTTGIEAICRGKDVISFNPSKRDWGIPFIDSGAAIKVTSEDNLIKYITLLVQKNETIIETLAENRKDFLKNHLSKEAPDFFNIISKITE